MLTMLDAVRPPLVFSDFAEHRGSLVQQLVDDAIFGRFLKVLKRMLRNVVNDYVIMLGMGRHLDNEGPSFVTRKRGPLPLE